MEERKKQLIEILKDLRFDGKDEPVEIQRVIIKPSAEEKKEGLEYGDIVSSNYTSFTGPSVDLSNLTHQQLKTRFEAWKKLIEGHLKAANSYASYLVPFGTGVKKREKLQNNTNFQEVFKSLVRAADTGIGISGKQYYYEDPENLDQITRFTDWVSGKVPFFVQKISNVYPEYEKIKNKKIELTKKQMEEKTEQEIEQININNKKVEEELKAFRISKGFSY